MAIYDRQKNLPQTVKNQLDEITDIKTTQIIGNDNLRVYQFAASLLTETVTTSGITVELRFVFDNPPSTSFVFMGIDWFASGSYLYDQFMYDVPQYIESTSEKRYRIRIIPNMTISASFWGNCQSTEKGTLTIARI